MKTIVITGVASGIGAAFMQLATKELPDYRIVGLTRDKTLRSSEANIQYISTDITSEADLRKAFTHILKEYGSIDVLINNAGTGMRGSIEDTSREELLKQLDVNLWPVLLATQLVLPSMRKQESGHIINVSSLAGTLPYPTIGLYGATKAFVEQTTETLAVEVSPWHIHASLLVAGAVKSKFGRSMQNIAKYNQATYSPLYEEWGKKFARLFVHPSDAEDAARGLISLIKNPKRRKFIRAKDRRAYLLQRFFGSVLFHRFFMNRHMRG